VYLFERDCSVQRRHQKVIEEAPAPGMTEERRQAMGEAAVAAARAVNYVGAGTVEFIVEPSGRFYFMEMNTRLQVEHPVTEMITGLDLVEWQLRVASGEALPLTQEQLTRCGHSIEARIYAENPEKNFIPSTGKIEKFHFPEENEFLRIESGIRKGSEISPYYDPMIAKISSIGVNRGDAVLKLKNALSSTIIYGNGLVTNILFLEKILMNEKFISGEFSTNFINDEFKNGFKATIDPDNMENINDLKDILIGALISGLENIQFLAAHNLSFFPLINKNFYLTFFLNEIRYFFKVHIVKQDSEIKIISIDDEILNLDILIVKNENNLLSLRVLNQSMMNNQEEYNCIDDRLFFKYINLDYNKVNIEHNALSLRVEIYSEKEFESFKKISKFRDELSLKSNGNNNMILKSPLPGVVSSIFVSESDIASETSKLLIIESMKMQNIILPQFSGEARVKKIFVKQGETIRTDQLMIEFENINENKSL
jgi:acetyl/propionyl-CoA carboxylase alpha subunit